MSQPFQFAGPVSLPADPTANLGAATKQYADGKIPYSYMQAYSSPGGLPEVIRLGAITQTVPFWAATDITTTSARTITAVFPVGWDAQVVSKTVSGFQFWVATAPSLASQSGAFAVYTGSALNSMTRVGSNGSFTLATATTGLKLVAFASPLTVVGTTLPFIAVQFSLSAPGSGVGAQVACTRQSSSALQCAGGKYGEWTASTVTPGATLDASAASSSAVLGQLAWVSLY